MNIQTKTKFSYVPDQLHRSPTSPIIVFDEEFTPPPSPTTLFNSTAPEEDETFTTQPKESEPTEPKQTKGANKKKLTITQDPQPEKRKGGRPKGITKKTTDTESTALIDAVVYHKSNWDRVTNDENINPLLEFKTRVQLIDHYRYITTKKNKKQLTGLGRSKRTKVDENICSEDSGSSPSEDEVRELDNRESAIQNFEQTQADFMLSSGYVNTIVDVDNFSKDTRDMKKIRRQEILRREQEKQELSNKIRQQKVEKDEKMRMMMNTTMMAVMSKLVNSLDDDKPNKKSSDHKTRKI
ncbi:lipase [Acrasis kona]|uniref:Lipase n=1 Tax=Acrasis kona TaxID=1008807 RepID=A0AAW2ZRV3_9EUKA